MNLENSSYSWILEFDISVSRKNKIPIKKKNSVWY